MFGILRIKRHTTNGSLEGMKKHNLREIDTPNADPEKTQYNQEVVGTGNYVKDVNDFIQSSGGIIQKNGVKAVEHLITASPEWWTSDMYDVNKFYNAIKRTIERFYGEHSKMVSCSYHLDEKTPHFHIMVVPAYMSKTRGSKKDKGAGKGKEVLRISARHFLNRPADVSRLQDIFGEEIAELGLQRGVKKSKAKHIPIRKYYSLQSKALEGVSKYKVAIPSVESPGRMILNPTKWAEEETQRIQTETNKQVSEVNRRLDAEAMSSLQRELDHLSGNATKKRKEEEEKLLQKIKVKDQKIDDLNVKISELTEEVNSFKDKLNRAEEETSKANQIKKSAIFELKEAVLGRMSAERLNKLKSDFESQEKKRKRGM